MLSPTWRGGHNSGGSWEPPLPLIIVAPEHQFYFSTFVKRKKEAASFFQRFFFIIFRFFRFQSCLWGWWSGGQLGFLHRLGKSSGNIRGESPHCTNFFQEEQMLILLTKLSKLNCLEKRCFVRSSDEAVMLCLHCLIVVTSNSQKALYL